MSKQFNSVSNGTYTLQEGENKNQLYFYRNDGGVLSNIDREPMDLYQAYIMQKMINGEITDMVMNNIYSEISEDRKYIRLTISDIGENPKKIAKRSDKPNAFKRFINKIFN